jgi:RHS repeat-associated protein
LGRRQPENLKQRQFEYDGLGRLTSVCEITAVTGSSNCGQANGQTGFWTRYKYDALGRLLGACENTTQSLSIDCVTTPSAGQQTRTYSYDGLGRLTAETNPENGATSYTYDTDNSCAFKGLSATSTGDLVSKSDANGNKTCYTFDSLHRITDQAVLKGLTTCAPPVKRFRYDSTANKILPAPSGYTASSPIGRLIEAWTGDCVWPTPSSGFDSATDEWFSYSARGETQDIWESTAHITGYYHGTASYEANGALTSIGGVSGYATVSYGLDGEGRPNTATQATTNLVTGVTYPPASQLKVVSLGAGDSDNYAYDAQTGRMTNFTFTVGSTPKSQIGNLTWNKNGTLRKLAMTDGFNSGGAQSCNFGTSSAMGYDDLGRLLIANCGSVWFQSFSYDPYGNLTQSGSAQWMPGYNAATNHAFGISYDNNGNITNDTFHNYGWYVDDKLGSIDSTTCTIFGSTDGTCILYDAFGREVEKGTNGGYQGFMYTPAGNMAITTIAGGVATTQSAKFPLPGGATLYETGSSGGSQYFLHNDWLGSTRLASSVAGRSFYFDRAFAPFGQTYNNFGNTGENTFAGDAQDLFLGFYDTPNREVSSSQGRFLSPDPGGLAAADRSNPQTWNRYAYALNNPLTYVDPTGLYCKWADGTRDDEESDGGASPNDCIGDPNNEGSWVDTTTVTVNGNAPNVPTNTFENGEQVFPEIVPLQPTFLNCVKSGTEYFSLQHGLQAATGGKMGNSWGSSAFLGSSVSSLITLGQYGVNFIAPGSNAPTGAETFSSTAGEALGDAAGPAASRLAPSVPNLAFTVAATAGVGVQTPTASTALNLSGSLTGTIPLNTAATTGAKALNILGTVKLPFDLAVGGFSALVCSLGR